jgi:hypothetical protein
VLVWHVQITKLGTTESGSGATYAWHRNTPIFRQAAFASSALHMQSLFHPPTTESAEYTCICWHDRGKPTWAVMDVERTWRVDRSHESCVLVRKQTCKTGDSRVGTRWDMQTVPGCCRDVLQKGLGPSGLASTSWYRLSPESQHKSSDASMPRLQSALLPGWRF